MNVPQPFIFIHCTAKALSDPVIHIDELHRVRTFYQMAAGIYPEEMPPEDQGFRRL